MKTCKWRESIEHVCDERRTRGGLKKTADEESSELEVNLACAKQISMDAKATRTLFVFCYFP